MRNAFRYAGLVLMVCLLTGLVLATVCFGGEQGTNADQQQLKNLISGYFASWNKPDMAAYKGCFHPLASIYFVDGAGNPHYSRVEEFIIGQAKFHQAAQQHQQRVSESPTKVSLTVHGRLAQAAVRWKLYTGSATVTGIDYFTLIKTDAGWRILSLAFENDKK
jgi:hypothetical protein